MALLKPASWIKIVLIILLCLVLCGGVLGCSLGCSAAARQMGNIAGAAYEGASYENHGDFSINFNETTVTGIEILWFAGGVDVVYSEADSDDAITGVEEFAGAAKDDLRMSWQLRHGVLQISYGPGNWGLFGCTDNGSKRLVLTIPKSYDNCLNTFDLTAASGNYNFEWLWTDYLNINLASGTVNGKDIDAQNLNLDIASGSVSLEGSFVEGVNVAMASGGAEIKCTADCPQNSSFDIMSGQCDLFLPQESGFTATIDKVSGSFNCDLQSYWSAKNPNVLVCNDGKKSMTANITSGNLHIKRFTH